MTSLHAAAAGAQVQPEVAAFGQRIRTAAKKVPLLGYFAQTPDDWHHE